jgi:hypothetical protein
VIGRVNSQQIDRLASVPGGWYREQLNGLPEFHEGGPDTLTDGSAPDTVAGSKTKLVPNKPKVLLK